MFKKWEVVNKGCFGSAYRETKLKKLIVQVGARRIRFYSCLVGERVFPRTGWRVQMP